MNIPLVSSATGSTTTLIIVAGIVIALIIITVLILLIRHWIKKQKAKKEEAKGEQLGSVKEAGGNAAADYYKELAKQKDAKAKIEEAKKSYQNLPVVEIGKQIWDAKGILDDDEDAVYAAIGRIPTKAALVYFAGYFKSYYGRELVTFLQSFMTNEELGKVYTMLSKLK